MFFDTEDSSTLGHGFPSSATHGAPGQGVGRLGALSRGDTINMWDKVRQPVSLSDALWGERLGTSAFEERLCCQFNRPKWYVAV